jgi:ElaB/YqjD/DUF883 family membrane-anchored ribosome-binding protein
MALVPGDLIAALGAGFGDEMTDVLLRTKGQLTEALKVEMTDEQDEAVERSLSAPGTAIKNVSHDLGNGVSQVLTTVESELPEAPAVTQDDLEEGQRKVGRQLADTRDQINETVTKVQSVIGNGRNTVTTANTSDGGVNGATPSTTRKTPVKDALQKANSDIKKTVTSVRNQVKKAFGGDKDSDGSGNGDGGKAERSKSA